MVELSQLDKNNFEQIALDVFHFQAKANHVYAEYLSNLKVVPNAIKNIGDIPFLPISFFKTHKVVATRNPVQKTFFSSGTGLEKRSCHHLTNLSLYEASFQLGFQQFYGNPENYCFVALLPSYLENESSSLIYMVDSFIKNSVYKESCYLLGRASQTLALLKDLQKRQIPTIVIGVSYALLDFAEEVQEDFSKIIFMETGGMKGRRKELIRSELHDTLKRSFNVQDIHSEYGMTELLSQAYALKNGVFTCPPWMKVVTRPINEPFGKSEIGETGVIQIIDLANTDSCAFIETSDLGVIHKNDTFEVLGRLDFADLRGCNLMLSN